MGEATQRGFAGVALRVASSAQRRIHRFGALGTGSIIRPPYTIVSASRIFIGAGTTIGPNALLSVITEHLGEHYAPTLRIGDDCSIGQNLVIGCIDNITIGDRVLISSNVFIGDTIHGYRDVGRAIIDQPLEKRGAVRIEDGAFLGINAIVLPNVTVGRNAAIGAGAVVAHDVPPYSVVAGNPARIIRRYDFVQKRWLAEEKATPARAA